MKCKYEFKGANIRMYNMEKHPIIISQPWGGLGDNLQFSTLPKLYSEAGHDVYISSKNMYRNLEIYDLVWKLNPYVKGIMDAEPNAGECKGYHLWGGDTQFIKNIEQMHGFHHSSNKYPIIYYTPKKIESLSTTVIYDMTSISSAYSDDFILERFTTVFRQYPECTPKKVVFKNIHNRATPDFNTGTIEINSIFDYCDLIYSCKAFVCLYSGCSVLAAAIKQEAITPVVHCFHHSMINTPGLYVFDNITYQFY